MSIKSCENYILALLTTTITLVIAIPNSRVTHRKCIVKLTFYHTIFRDSIMHNVHISCNNALLKVQCPIIVLVTSIQKQILKLRNAIRHVVVWLVLLFDI